jgi:hypothetical protein
MLRHAVYEAANSYLRIAKKWSVLRAWGLKLAGAFRSELCQRCLK